MKTKRRQTKFLTKAASSTRGRFPLIIKVGSPLAIHVKPEHSINSQSNSPLRSTKCLPQTHDLALKSPTIILGDRMNVERKENV